MPNQAFERAAHAEEEAHQASRGQPSKEWARGQTYTNTFLQSLCVRQESALPCMYADVRVCVCMYVYIYIYIYSSLLLLYILIYIKICIYICMYVHTHIYIYIYIYIHIYIYTYIHIYIYICVCVCVSVCLSVCLSFFLSVCLRVRVGIHGTYPGSTVAYSLASSGIFWRNLEGAGFMLWFRDAPCSTWTRL